MRDYLAYKSALDASVELGWKMRDIYQKYRKRVLDKTILSEYVFCQNAETNLMTYSITNVYIKNHFSQTAKMQVDTHILDNKAPLKIALDCMAN